ncbi:SigE family RNA polymerase sigma factor [Microlunatus spumicola]|uniref:SigE family RNA polymerase sigma factor n=1 Tax=Microlunatus spumicola TaxID=81499 RepID=A0ABP6WRS2_9ACTN
MEALSSTDASRSRDVTAELSIDALFAAHHVRLVRVAWLLVRDSGRAEELVQDAFVDLHRRWSRLRTPEDAAGYLHVSVVNRSRSVLRHQKVVSATPPERLEVEESAETEALRGVERRRVLDGLARLPRRQREVLVLRYYAQLTEAETAHVLGIGRGSVKSHGSRGICALRTVLGGPDED